MNRRGFVGRLLGGLVAAAGVVGLVPKKTPPAVGWALVQAHGYSEIAYRGVPIRSDSVWQERCPKCDQPFTYDLEKRTASPRVVSCGNGTIEHVKCESGA